ncbi:Retrovirus-related Pol polyprotein from transposon opus, partial [Mucuna pruriens]
MESVQQNYITTKKELLAIVFALDKFCSYLLVSKIMVFSDHDALRYLLKKSDVMPRLIRWMLLLQEFNIEIRDKKGLKEKVNQCLSKTNSQMSSCCTSKRPHHGLPTSAIIWQHLNFHQKASQPYKDKIRSDAKYYVWDDPYLWRLCSDQVIRRCIPDTEINLVLQFCHSTPRGDHYGSTRTAKKVLDCGLYWPIIFQDAYHFVSTCDKCQKAEMTINRRHGMPQ